MSSTRDEDLNAFKAFFDWRRKRAAHLSAAESPKTPSAGTVAKAPQRPSLRPESSKGEPPGGPSTTVPTTTAMCSSDDEDEKCTNCYRRNLFCEPTQKRGLSKCEPCRVAKIDCSFDTSPRRTSMRQKRARISESDGEDAASCEEEHESDATLPARTRAQVKRVDELLEERDLDYTEGEESKGRAPMTPKPSQASASGPTHRYQTRRQTLTPQSAGHESFPSLSAPPSTGETSRETAKPSFPSKDERKEALSNCLGLEFFFTELLATAEARESQRSNAQCLVSVALKNIKEITSAVEELDADDPGFLALSKLRSRLQAIDASLSRGEISATAFLSGYKDDIEAITKWIASSTINET